MLEIAYRKRRMQSGGQNYCTTKYGVELRKTWGIEGSFLAFGQDRDMSRSTVHAGERDDRTGSETGKGR